MRTKYCTANYPTKRELVNAILRSRGELDETMRKSRERTGISWRIMVEHHPLFLRNTKDELIEMARKEIPGWADKYFPPLELTAIADEDTLDCIFD